MFYEKLKTICKNRGTNITRMCLDLGLASSSTGHWKAGKTPKPASLVRISEYLGVSVDYLLSDDNSEEKTKGVRIPVLGVVRAGIPIEAVEEVLDYEDITPELAKSGEYFALSVSGDSMEPKISEGDVVIVRKQPTAETGDVCVILINGSDATIKKIKRTPSGITLIPSNPNYDVMFFTNSEIQSLPVTIIGRVVELRAKY